MSELFALSRAQRLRASGAQGTRRAAVDLHGDRRKNDPREEVRQMVGSGWVEELVIRGETRPEVISAIVQAARECGRKVRLTDNHRSAGRPEAQNGEKWVQEEDTEGFSWVLVPPQRSGWQVGLKRLLDVSSAAGLLLTLLPFLVAIAVAVKLTSHGPVLYRWRVLGENGRPFVGYKFRTMVRNADALKNDLLHLNERQGPVFKIAKDPRTTRCGRWLRKHSLDELPQLWSVLVGDMSLVGPRPVFRAEYEKCELWQMRKLSVKPGLTCLWQLDGRQTFTDYADWARQDLRYIDTWSLWNDFAILLRTPMVLIRGTGH